MSPATPFTERMKRIGHTIKIHDFLHKFIVEQSLKKLCSAGVNCVLFLLILTVRAFPCPVIQVRKKEAVDLLVVVKVKRLDLRCTQPLSIAGRGKRSLNFIQFFFVSDVKLVDQNRRTRIAVSGNGIILYPISYRL